MGWWSTFVDWALQRDDVVHVTDHEALQCLLDDVEDDLADRGYT